MLAEAPVERPEAQPGFLVDSVWPGCPPPEYDQVGQGSSDPGQKKGSQCGQDQSHFVQAERSLQCLKLRSRVLGTLLMLTVTQSSIDALHTTPNNFVYS